MPEQEALPRVVLQAELDAHPVPVRLRERQQSHEQPAQPVHHGHLLPWRPAQLRIDDQIRGPYDGDGCQRHDDGARAARSQRPSPVPGRPAARHTDTGGQHQQHRNRRQRAHLRRHGALPAPRRRAGRTAAAAGGPPQQPHRRQQKPAAGTSSVASEPCAMTSGEKAYRARAANPAAGARQFTGEGEHDQPEQQGQHDHRQPGPEHQPPRIVAGLVQQMPARRGSDRPCTSVSRCGSAIATPAAITSLPSGGCSGL